MIISQILIILRVTNAVSSLGQKVCISIIKPCEIRKEIEKKNLFYISCFKHCILVLSIPQKVGDIIMKNRSDGYVEIHIILINIF